MDFTLQKYKKNIYNNKTFLDVNKIMKYVLHFLITSKIKSIFGEFINATNFMKNV